MLKKTNILVIEGSRHDYTLIKQALQHSDKIECIIHHASDGEKAIKLLKTDKSYDLIILDYELSGKNGLEVLQKIKNTDIDIPVLFITAPENEPMANYSLTLGAQEYLMKDRLGKFLDVLPNMIKKMLQEWEIGKRYKSAIENLQKSEERYQALIQNSYEGIWCFEAKEPIPINLEEDEIINRIYANSILVECNDTMAQMYGFKKREDIIGTPLKNFLVPNKQNIEYLKNFIRHDFVLRDGESWEPDNTGKVHIYLNNLTGIIKDGCLLQAWGTQRDITSQKREQQIRETLYNISKALVTSDSLEELFKAIHKELSNIIDTTNFYITLYDEKSNIITAPYYFDQIKNTVPPPQTLRNGLTAYVIRSKEPLYLTVEKREQLMKEGKIAQADWKSKIWLGVPLKVKEKVIGAMAVQSYTDANAYTEDDLKLMETVSDQIALAISHKQQEEATKLSEKYYKDTINSMVDAILVVDKDLNITLANASLFNLSKELGLPTNLTGRNLFEVFPFLSEKVQKEYKQIFATPKTLTAERTYQINNQTFIIYIQKTPFLQNEKPAQVITVLRDLTKEREIETKYQNQLRNLLDIGMSIRSELDLNELTQKVCNIIVQSLGWRQVILSLRDYDKGISRPVAMAGYAKEEVKEILNASPVPIEKTERFLRDEFKISKSFYIDHTHWEEMQGYPGGYIITPVKEQTPEGWHEHDALLIPIYGKEKILGFLSPDNPINGKKPSVDDIQALEIFADQVGVALENAQIYEKLKYSQSRLQGILANIKEMIWEIDNEGRITYSSSIAEKILGYKPEEIIGKYFYEIVSPDNEQMLKKLYSRIKRKKRSFKDFVIQAKTKNGKEVICSLSGIPTIDRRGNFTGYSGSTRDITLEKIAQDKLKASEEKYKTLITNSVDSIYMHDLDGNFTLVNPAMCKILGYSAKELLHMNISDILTPEGLKLAKEKTEHKIITQKPTPPYELSIINKEGLTIPVEINSAPIIKNQKVVAVQGIVRDMRTQKRIEKQIRESLRKQEMLYNIATAAATLNTVEELLALVREELGRFIDVTNFYVGLLDKEHNIIKLPYEIDQKDKIPIIPADTSLTGYVVRTGKTLVANQDCINELKQKGEIEIIGELSKIWVGVPLKLEKEVLGAMVVQSYTDENAYSEEDIQILEFVANQTALIIDRKQHDCELQKTKSQLQDLFDNANDIIWTSDIDKKFLMVNHSFETLLGYARKDLLEQDFTKIVKTEAREKAINAFQKAISGKQSECEVSFLTKEGEERIFWLKLRPLKEDNKIVGVHCIGRDITEWRQTEKELRKKNEELLQAQKMESIGRLAGGIAHDFNNMLTIINGRCNKLLQKMPANDPFRREVEEILKAGTQAASITNQLLIFGRKKAWQPTNIDVNKMIKEMYDVLRHLLRENVEIETHLQAQSAIVKIDPAQLEQVIMNLCINASDAMPEGGKLKITTETINLNGDHAKSHIERKPGKYLKITVSDTGVGMNDNVRSHIFEPFYTTKKAGEGTGLGLTTVYAIVQQSNGFINAYSQIGKGSTFEVFLPISQEEIPALQKPAELQKEIESQHLANETILIVEDQDMVRELTYEILADRGYIVLLARTGDEAYSICQNYNEDIDLMITDVILPDMNGYELYQKASTVRSKMKILFISGYPGEDILEKGIAEKLTPFLQKPFSPQKLLLTVQKILSK